MGQIRIARALCYVMHDIGQDLEEQWWLMRQVLESIKRKRVRDQCLEVRSNRGKCITVESGVGEIATPVDTERQKPIFFFPDVGQRRASSHVDKKRVGSQVAILAWKGAVSRTHWVLVNVRHLRHLPELTSHGLGAWTHSTQRPPSGMLVPHSHHKQIPLAVSGRFQ